jgi:hypothetical protein
VFLVERCQRLLFRLPIPRSEAAIGMKKPRGVRAQVAAV